jgi:hypothetical protein
MASRDAIREARHQAVTAIRDVNRASRHWVVMASRGAIQEDRRRDATAIRGAIQEGRHRGVTAIRGAIQEDRHRGVTANQDVKQASHHRGATAIRGVNRASHHHRGVTEQAACQGDQRAVRLDRAVLCRRQREGETGYLLTGHCLPVRQAAGPCPEAHERVAGNYFSCHQFRRKGHFAVPNHAVDPSRVPRCRANVNGRCPTNHHCLVIPARRFGLAAFWRMDSGARGGMIVLPRPPPQA